MDAEALRALLPQGLRALPLRRLATAGNENDVWRLGPALALRVPRHAEGAESLRRQAEWLPRLAVPFLRPPLALLPGPVALGPWVEGQDAWAAPPADEAALGRDLAALVGALRGLGLPGPTPGLYGRGEPLLHGDAAFRAALAQAPEIDARRAGALWDRALAAPPHAGRPTWFHGDLQPFNLVLREGRLVAAIDWGTMGTGDPACELMTAWQCLATEDARRPLRDLVDEDEWERGKGWALLKAMLALPFYRRSNPTFAAFARRTLDRVLADQGS